MARWAVLLSTLLLSWKCIVHSVFSEYSINGVNCYSRYDH